MLSSHNGGAARTFTYGYLTNSRLLETLAVTNPGGGVSPFSVTRHYESNRNMLAWIKTDWSGAGTLARFDYAYNDRGQREWEKRSGTTFAIGGSPVTIDYQYNHRGELTKALSYLETEGDIGDAAKRMPNLQHEYAYDNFGNRTSANQTGDPSANRVETFTTNEHNQIVSRENETVFASGVVASGASVVVSADGALGAPERQGLYWSRAHTPDNASGADKVDFTIRAALSGAVRTETRSTLAPQRTQSLQYDEDGNLKNDSVWTYSWDGENRLSAMEMLASVPAGVTRRKLEFAYDYLGRRVQKKVSAWSGSAWQLQSATRFLYDGWNLVAEYDAPGGTAIGHRKRTYTWGLDPGGSLSATGAAGALLQITHYDSSGNPTASHLPTYDGNGNLVALYDAAGAGTAVAAYEYSPFGELLRCEGAYAMENPFRFSTKYTDDETGLVYYGHRHYSPTLGRFINRDPIREAGGANIYAIAGNDPVNQTDVLGLGLLEWVYGVLFGERGYGGGPIWPETGNAWDVAFGQWAEREHREAQNRWRLDRTAAANEEHRTQLQTVERLLRAQSPDKVYRAAMSPVGSEAANSKGREGEELDRVISIVDYGVMVPWDPDNPHYIPRNPESDRTRGRKPPLPPLSTALKALLRFLTFADPTPLAGYVPSSQTPIYTINVYYRGELIDVRFVILWQSGGQGPEIRGFYVYEISGVENDLWREGISDDPEFQRTVGERLYDPSTPDTIIDPVVRENFKP
ncbi:hypothetical protein ASA1KI_15110 [Opitutales bacterium ASA1]|nr:hypothetical protein ASA1KI_15110 [Opitutales bacterium ASA1]